MQVQQKTQNQILQMFDLAMQEQNFQMAEILVQKLIEVDQENPHLYSKKATIQFDLNKYQKAVQTIREAQKKFKTADLKLQNILLKCWLQLERNEEARHSVKQYLDNNTSIQQYVNLVAAIDKLEQQSIYSLSEEQNRIIGQMRNWLTKAGATFQKVKIINQAKNYRTAITTKQIKKGQTIIFIPKQQLMQLQLARKNPIAVKLQKCNIQLNAPKHSLMAIYLLQQKNQTSSKFKPYIDILPQDHSCFPINFTADELTELIGSTFLFQIREKVVDLKRDYDMIASCCSQFVNHYNFKDFCWARMMVGSRVFGVTIDGVKTQVLAPFADMLNHKSPKECAWNYSSQRQGFYIKSLRSISVGSQITYSYGKKCNSRYLLNYGFVIQDNDRNQICIKVDISSQDTLFEKKLELLQMKGEKIITYIFRITKYVETDKFFELMGFLRFKNIHLLENLLLLEKISHIQSTKKAYNPLRTPPTCLEVEIKIWEELKNLCIQLLKGYSTSIQEDRQMLSQKNISYNMKNILVLRIGEKQLLQLYINRAQRVIKMLKRGYVQALKEAKTHAQQDYCRYISKILMLMPHEENPLMKNGTIKDPKLLEQQNIFLSDEQQDLTE